MVERHHHHVLETGFSLLVHSSVPPTYWSFAFSTAVYLINRMPSRSNQSLSPFQHLFGTTPDYSFLKSFGCLCFPHLRPYNRHKLDFRSTPCVFLGYNTTHHGYLCLSPMTHKIYISYHVRFNEIVYPFHQLSSSPTFTSPVFSTSPWACCPSPSLASLPLTLVHPFHLSNQSTLHLHIPLVLFPCPPLCRRPPLFLLAPRPTSFHPLPLTYKLVHRHILHSPFLYDSSIKPS